jgi:hypothetical protein
MPTLQWHQVVYPGGTGYVHVGGAYHQSVKQFIAEKLAGWSFEGDPFEATVAEIEKKNCGEVVNNMTKLFKSPCKHGSCIETQS